MKEQEGTVTYVTIGKQYAFCPEKTDELLGKKYVADLLAGGGVSEPINEKYWEVWFTYRRYTTFTLTLDKNDIITRVRVYKRSDEEINGQPYLVADTAPYEPAEHLYGCVCAVPDYEINRLIYLLSNKSESAPLAELRNLAAEIIIAGKILDKTKSKKQAKQLGTK